LHRGALSSDTTASESPMPRTLKPTTPDTPAIVHGASPTSTASLVKSTKGSQTAATPANPQSLHGIVSSAHASHEETPHTSSVPNPGATPKGLDGDSLKSLASVGVFDDSSISPRVAASKAIPGGQSPENSAEGFSSFHAVPSKLGDIAGTTSDANHVTVRQATGAINSFASGVTLAPLYFKGVEHYVLGSISILVVLFFVMRPRRDMSSSTKHFSAAASATSAAASAATSDGRARLESEADASVTGNDAVSASSAPHTPDNASDTTAFSAMPMSPLSLVGILGLEKDYFGTCLTSAPGCKVVAIKWEVDPGKQQMALDVATFDADDRGESSKVVMRLQSLETGKGEETDGVQLQDASGFPLAFLATASCQERTPSCGVRKVTLSTGAGGGGLPLLTFRLKSELACPVRGEESGGLEEARHSVAMNGHSDAERHLDLAVAQLVGCAEMPGHRVVVAQDGNGDGGLGAEPLFQVLLDEEGQPVTVFMGSGTDVLAEFGTAGPPFPNGWRALRVPASSNDLPLMVAAVVAARKLA